MLIYILGTAQDGGYPHPGCTKTCCTELERDKNLVRYASSIALIDESSREYWLLDITPDYKKQIGLLDSFNCSLKGVFITHAHVGHYLGIMNFGLEIMNLDKIPVYVMPKMKFFMENNPMIEQLSINNNIDIQPLHDNLPINLYEQFQIIPFEVPHRNELSETVGFRIMGEKESAIYLPDIDSWDGWENNLCELVSQNNFLFIDGTFFTKDEIKNRDISKIPHPEIVQTMDILSDIDFDMKKKVYFIHLNHTNDAIRNDSESYQEIIDSGFNVAEEKLSFNIN